jgi:hypothetical protein
MVLEANMEKLLAVLFPPKFHFVESYEEACVAHNDFTARPVTEDGVVWRGYDVRRLGIERVQE